jgi:hypothetical protein
VPETLEQGLDRWLAAYDAIAELGEDVEEEWSYVNDLANAWRARMQELVGRRADEPIAPALTDALDVLIAEMALIEDPHRAIDWLSTAPQVALLALGEQG